jgi:hypothetical protein
MKLVKRIKSFFRNDNAIQSEKIVISQKSCPHCTSRGMFVFKNTSNIKTEIGESNENHK